MSIVKYSSARHKFEDITIFFKLNNKNVQFAILNQYTSIDTLPQRTLVTYYLKETWYTKYALVSKKKKKKKNVLFKMGYWESQIATSKKDIKKGCKENNEHLKLTHKL